MNPEQYTHLFQDYLANVRRKAKKGAKPEISELETQYAHAFKAAINYLQKNTRSEVFDLAAMGTADKKIQSKQKANIRLLHQFLNQTIDARKKPFHFREEAAPGVKASIIDPALKMADHLYIYDAPQHLGIQEKYARGLLTGKQELTGLDMQRMLELTGCKEKVKVVPFTVKCIAAALDATYKDINAKRKNKLIHNVAGDYYTIPLLLKDEKNGISNWLAVQILYYHTNNEISYEINDSADLSEERKQEYKGIIEAALKSEDNFYPGFKDMEVTQDEPESSLSGDQTDSGYRALHYLYQNKEIIGDNENAKDYAQIDPSSDPAALVKKFYEIQLTDLTLPLDVYEAFAKQEQFKVPIADEPSQVRVDEVKLQAFMENLQAEDASIPTSICKAVQDGMGAYAVGDTFISFPSGIKDENLDAIQYTQYFSYLGDKVLNPGVPMIQVMRLNHCDGEALKGLNNFLAVSEAMPFKTLQIDIDINPDDADVFVKNLQLALKNLSRYGLSRVQLFDAEACLNAAHYKQLQHFIVAEDIALRIDLPAPHNKTDLQRQIDTATAINQRNKNSDSLKTVLKQEKVVAQQKKERPKRTRGEIDFTQNLDTDVELQAQADIEETVAIERLGPIQRKMSQYAGFERLTLEDLEKAVAGAVADDSLFAQFAEVAGGLSKEDFVNYWHTLSSNITLGKLQLGKTKITGHDSPGTQQIGRQVVYVNPQFDGFTDQSLARLIQFKEYFREGINFEQLPSGFLLIPNPIEPQKVLLHYDPASEARDTLAPKLVAKLSKNSLNIDSVERLMADDKTNESLKIIWKSLQESQEYSQEENELFRKYVPELMDLEPEQLELVVRLCDDTGEYFYNTLAFIFENLDKAKRSYADPYHEQSLVSVEWMKKSFPDIEDRKDFVNFANSIEPHIVAQHALFTLLEQDADTELQELLAQSTKDYQLTDRELNGLLRIYDKYGSGGLERLLTKLASINAALVPLVEEVPLAKELSMIVKNTSDYEKLLVDDEVLEAVEAIGRFDDNKKQWWDHLYGVHIPKEDNFLAVYKSFIAFTGAIGDYKLTFYDLRNKDSESLFKGADNLPSTLGRMLSILNLCNPADIKLQWEAMSDIDLSSQGALRAMTHAKGTDRACGFVVPEMEIDPHVELNLYENLYDPSYTWFDIGGSGKSPDTRIIYKYLAYENHRLPLDFYKDAFARINKIFPGEKIGWEAKLQLHALLLASTTGDNYRFYIKDQHTAMKHWEDILDVISDVKSSIPGMKKRVFEIAIQQLFGLANIPSLPVLARVTKLSMAPFHVIKASGIVFGGIEAEGAKLEKLNERLNKLLKAHDNTVYLGMRLYNDDDYQERADGTSLYNDHLEVAEAIDEADAALYLMEHISTFHLASADVEELANVFKLAVKNSEYAKIFFYHAMHFLKDIDHIEKPNEQGNLTAEDLKQFLLALSDQLDEILPELQQQRAIARVKMDEALEETTQQEKAIGDRQAELRKQGALEDSEAMQQAKKEARAIQVKIREIIALERKDADKVYEQHEQQAKDKLLGFVETHLGAYFKDDYFAGQRAGEAIPEVNLFIKHAFVDSSIQLSIKTILQPYVDMDVTEQIQLVTLLEAICADLNHADTVELLKFLNLPELKATNIDDYLVLLTAIREQGSSSFIYFVQSAEDLPESVINLTEKAIFFLTKALPQIRENKNKLVGEIDVIDLVIDVVLAAKEDELKSQFEDINSSLVVAYTKLKDALEQQDATEIKSVIDNLPPYANIDDIDGISDLKAHLAWLEKEEMEDVEVTPARTVKVRVAKESPAGAIERGFGNFMGGFRNLFGMKPEKVEVEPGYEEIESTEPAVMGQKRMVKIIDEALLTRVSNSLEDVTEELKSYTRAVGETFSLINSMIEKYPGAKSQILAQSRHYLTFNTTGGRQIEEAFNTISLLKQEFDALDDQDLVIGLCEHFGAIENEHSDFNYQHLLALFKGEDPFENKLKPRAKKQILSVVNSLLNNGKPCSLENIQYLIVNCSNSKKGKRNKQILELAFKNAPFPSFEQLNGWFEGQKTRAEVRKEYNHWSLEPVPREEGVNGFDLDMARKQIEKLEGATYTDDELKALDEAVNGETGVKNLNARGVIKAIQKIQADSAQQIENREDPTRLVALIARLLYLTKGLEAVVDEEENREWGRSFEINTTQYLAIHSMLKAGGHVTGQIGTGEGKTRIMMIAVACQYALGNTVDFVTSDMSLVTRDYLEYQSFFKAMGAKTALIKANMPAEQYEIKDGINFSDATNLSLFRNKARSEGNGDKVIHRNPEQRALMLDEADKTYFDCSNTRFNYSAQADPNLRDMEWIYEVLVEFFSEDANVQLYEEDAEQCNIAFKTFARGQPLKEEQKARLEFNKNKPMPVISDGQLEAWQNAAITALQRKYQEHFTLVGDVIITTKEGPKKVSQAQLLASGRASDSGKLSFGVHQCLHARLNLIKAGKLPNDELRADKSAMYELTQFEKPFHIDPETRIVYSSTNKSFLGDYSKGELLAVTGTSGSIYERVEAESAFGRGDNEPMQFIDVPRHRGQKRIDKPVQLAKNEMEHRKKTLKSVIAALKKEQAILLVCENDNESTELLAFLNTELARLPEKQKIKLKINLTQIDAKTNSKDEAKHVQNEAGKPGAITVSTAMLGRGTDIKLHGAAKKHGLHVIATYLPRERDYWQIIGRAGRFGAQGKSQLILDKERVSKRVGTEIPPVEFYTATENYIKGLQEQMDSYEQRQRLVKYVVNDYRFVLTNLFFSEFKVSFPHQEKQVLLPWQKFLDKSDKFWNELSPQIQVLLHSKPIDVAQIDSILSQYQKALQSEWKTMSADFKTKIESGSITPSEGAKPLVALEEHEFEPLKLPERVLSLLSPKQEEKERILQTPIANKYSSAFVGRAVIYTSILDSFRAFFKNIAAASRGDGPWFPNLKAWQNKNMSTSQLLFGSWGSPLVKASLSKEEMPQLNEEVEDELTSPKRMRKGLGKNKNATNAAVFPENEENVVTEEEEKKLDDEEVLGKEDQKSNKVNLR